MHRIFRIICPELPEKLHWDICVWELMGSTRRWDLLKFAETILICTRRSCSLWLRCHLKRSQLAKVQLFWIYAPRSIGTVQCPCPRNAILRWATRFFWWRCWYLSHWAFCSCSYLFLLLSSTATAIISPIFCLLPTSDRISWGIPPLLTLFSSDPRFHLPNFAFSKEALMSLPSAPWEKYSPM